MRLWVASKDQPQEKGDFINILNKDIDKRSSEINIIRKCFWNILGLLKDYQFAPRTSADKLKFVIYY